MNFITPIICATLIYTSIFVGYALYCPLLPIIFISNRLYRYLTDIFFSFWLLYPTVLIERICKSKITVYGDTIQAGKNNVIMMNHRTRPEWVFLWAALYHGTEGPSKYNYPLKYLLKDIFRHMPGPGWIMQLMCFLYIKKEWKCDVKCLTKLISYFCDMSYKCCLLIYPEGTVYTAENMKASYKYAERNNLEKFDYVMHPKKKGFCFSVGQLLSRNKLDAVYDLTMLLPDIIPQTEGLLLSGYVPKETIFIIKRYPLSELPNTEEGLISFVNNRWSEKEKTLRDFYVNNIIPEGQLLRCRDTQILYVALIFWTILPFLILYSVYLYSWFRYIIFAHTLFLFYLNYVRGYGFQEFEADLFQFKKKTFGFAF